ncbi:MAG TPA: sulfatase-like hydrolase/transferase [Burkholderiales bacterium]|nr:sulfatase-like hydrolase/transferase [Burkholderiales bacterium]
MKSATVVVDSAVAPPNNGAMAAAARNVLFLMCDQLRADYLSCYGAKRLHTPNIDALAARGTRFERAFVAAPVCGPSRMSFYTGRYAFSHGATWNFVPLPAGEPTLGDYLRPAGIRTAVVGKTHHEPDLEGMKRLGLSPTEGPSRFVAEGGFEPYARDDGIHPDARKARHQAYNDHLRARGYAGANPWHDYANAALDEKGELASGWRLRNANRAARIPDELSESAWTVDRAIDFVREQGEKPWCLHVSFIKPHWPYIVSAPYHAMFAREDCPPPVRSAGERGDVNPLFKGFQQHPECVAFSRDEVRLNVVPAYMGLVKQVDTHLGRLMAALEAAGRMRDTLVVFTSDHGDYLGDHWQGEKEFMYEQGVRVPLIVVDPSAKAQRGAASDALVEGVDLVPTFLEALGLALPTHIVEGRSLLPLLRGAAEWPREAAFSELDFAIYPTARKLGLGPREARMVMVRTAWWKLVHFGKRFPPQLFDLRNDPDELDDRGADPGTKAVGEELYGLLFDWMRDRRNRIAMTDEAVARRPSPAAAGGVTIGVW